MINPAFPFVAIPTVFGPSHRCYLSFATFAPFLTLVTVAVPRIFNCIQSEDTAICSTAYDATAKQHFVWDTCPLWTD